MSEYTRFRRLGMLWNKLPPWCRNFLTAWVCIIGLCTIAGLGIAGLYMFAQYVDANFSPTGKFVAGALTSTAIISAWLALGIELIEKE